MNYEAFTFSIDEYGISLTEQSHQTLYWLNRNGYLTNEVTEELLSRMIVVPIRNKKSFGERLLARFFNKDSAENSYVFPITLVDDVYNQHSDGSEGKPHLKVVK